MNWNFETLAPTWTDYEFLDSGNSKKLERFGEYVLIRPEPQAKWPPSHQANQWDAADGEFARTARGKQGAWRFRRPMPERWPMQRGELKFWVQPAPSGHVGLFPDQACHWDWIAAAIPRAARPVKVICLFGYTGLATLAAAAGGAEVTHVDASRKAVAWARENQSLSGLADRPIRWIVEDAVTFVQREARRGNYYDALMLDPPTFGRGPGGQVWKLDKSLPELLGACAQVLRPAPVFVLLNVYVTVLTSGHAEAQAEGLRSIIKTELGNSAGGIQCGELTIPDGAGRRIVTSVFARTCEAKLSC